MQAFTEFRGKDASFWAFIKFISENLGYTIFRKNMVKSYCREDICSLCKKYDMPQNPQLIKDAVLYSELRANLLNNIVEKNLMDSETARLEFNRLFPNYKANHLKCTLPMNKQSGEMRQIAYFTAIINILTELTIRDITGNSSEKGFDDDPRGLAYIWDRHKNLLAVTSRRFDGAFPSIKSPTLVWEIKEYYYTTSFGSRIADGIYETQLDGFEFKELYERSGQKVFHVLFIDAYNTWWNMGKSYLCRIIDALNSGLVDEVIIGKEVFSRWPDLLHEII